MIMSTPDLIISRQDLGRLDVLLSDVAYSETDKVRDFLLDELARASVVDRSDLPPTVVAMYSTVEFRDNDSGRHLVLKLVYPHETSYIGQAVSVLTPVGAALIGLSVGQSIGYETPDGRLKTLTVVRVLRHGSLNPLARKSVSSFRRATGGVPSKSRYVGGRRSVEH
jgi:regulator of nucleoside diphosphate kinase